MGSLVPQCISQGRDMVWKHPATLSGSSFHSLSLASPSSTAPQDSSSQSDVNKSLLEILKMTLRAAKGKLNMENLNLSFRKEDHSFSGYLPPPKVTKLEFRFVHLRRPPQGIGSIVRRHSWDLRSACGLHYTIVCFLCPRGEKQKRKGILKYAELVRELLTLGYVLC